LGLTFFGLTSISAKEYRVKFLSQIHEICFYGQGGYSWTEVYEMPLWLRKFVYKKIKNHYDKKAEQIKQAKSPQNSVNLINSDGTVKNPTKSKYS
jgi:hypothetical protein